MGRNLTGELGIIRRYAYWSDRRIRSIAADNSIDLERRWLLGVKLPTFLSILPQAELVEQQRTAQRHEISLKVDRAIGRLAVEDFVTSPPVRFAKGRNDITLAAYSHWHYVSKSERKGIIAHTSMTSGGKRVEVCLFGSLEHCTDYISASEKEAPMWSSSSTWSIEEFIRNHGTVPDSLYDDDQSMAHEIVRVFRNEGMTGEYVFKKIASAEWFAEIYLDVELDKKRWDQRPTVDWPYPIDRIVVGAPLWIRS